MLYLTFAYNMLVAAGSEALPHSFASDKRSIDVAVHDPSAPAPMNEIVGEAFSPYVASQNASFISPTPSPTWTVVVNLTVTPTHNSTMSSIITHLPPPTMMITLQLPGPTPHTQTERSRDEEVFSTDDGQDAAATPFDSSASEPTSKGPRWLVAANFTLIIYDLLTLGMLLWLWAFGYLWWSRRDRGRSSDAERVWRRRGGESEWVEMAEMDMERMFRFGGEGPGQYSRTINWVRTGLGCGRVRSETWKRARRAREAELEGEMRRLGMI